MEKMKAWVSYGNEKMELEEIEKPKAGPGEVLVKIRAVGICGSDIHYYKDGGIGDFTVDEPIVLCHECSGDIVELGEGVDPGRLGERVIIEPGIPCFHCHDCKTGRYHYCRNMQFMATPPVNGCLCEYVAWPEELVYSIPDDMSYEAGSTVEPFVVGLQAMRNSGIGFSSSAVVLGTGPIAMTTIQSLKTIGAGKIICIGRTPWKLELAQKMGATHVINSRETEDVVQAVKDLTDGYGGMYVFEAVGTDKTYWQATELCREGGTLCLLGLMPHDGTKMPLASVVMHGINFAPVIRYSNLFEEALELIKYGRSDVTPIISETFPFEKAQDAFQKVVHDNHNVMKIVIKLD